MIKSDFGTVAVSGAKPISDVVAKTVSEMLGKQKEE